MGRFIFTLQNVLNVKAKVEEQKKLELGNANKQLALEEQALNNLKMEREKYLEAFYIKKDNFFKAKDLVAINKGIKYYNDEIAYQEACIDKAKKFVELKREELKEAIFEKKKYELLREKAYYQYLEREKENEKKVLDEVVNYNYSRQAR